MKSEIAHKPILIVIAGPDGSGKTSITTRLLKHEWVEDSIYVNPDNVAKDGEEAKLLFRLVNGVMGKMYVTDVPLWAQAILPDMES